jgi:hypothetical protein
MQEHCLVLHAPPCSPAELDTVVNLIYRAFNLACEATMERKGANCADASRWWNPDCDIATTALADATTDEARTAANKRLHLVIKWAKREWADRHITLANVWDVAAWRHGCRQTQIPALQEPGDDELTFDHEGMASILSKCFFTEQREAIGPLFPDDPPPVPTRDWSPLMEEETLPLLMGAANSSTPGISGIGWLLLKAAWLGHDKIWDGLGNMLLNIFEGCIALGHHPTR